LIRWANRRLHGWRQTLVLLLVYAVACACAGAVGFAIYFLTEEIKSRWPGRWLGLLLYFFVLFAVATLAAWLGPRVAKDTRLLQADTPSFVLLCFLCLLPLFNAVFDVLSLAATRWFLQRHLKRGGGWLWMTLADLLLAALLTALLFFGVFALLHALQALGWGVDAPGMLARFRQDPAAPEVSWILWMALTNVLPTALHLSLACAGLWSGWLRRDPALAASLHLQPPKPSPLLAADMRVLPQPGGAHKPLLLQEPLLAAQAQKLWNWVYVDFWLAAALPGCLALALWPVWPQLLHGLLQLLP
jgi:hypothetical protein